MRVPARQWLFHCAAECNGNGAATRIFQELGPIGPVAYQKISLLLHRTYQLAQRTRTHSSSFIALSLHLLCSSLTTMSDRDDSVWDGLGSIDAFIDTPPISPHSPEPSSPPWVWTNVLPPLPPPPMMMQVRLDGELASDLDFNRRESSPSSNPLPVSTGRVTKRSPSPRQPPIIPPQSRTDSQPRYSSASRSAPPAEQSPRPFSPLPAPLRLPKVEPTVQPPAISSPTTPDPSPVLPQSLAPVLTPKSALPTPTPSSVPNSSAPPPPPPQVLHHPVQHNNLIVTPPQTKRRQPTTPLPPAKLKSPVKHPVAAQPTPSPEQTCSLKEKREREARQFPKEILGNLDGTTSAEVRKMNATERELVLYKRKLRNRESARRSRQKRQATLAELQEEIDDLMQVSGRMVEVGISLREENARLREKFECAMAEVKGLRSMYAGVDGQGTSAAASALKMKLGG